MKGRSFDTGDIQGGAQIKGVRSIAAATVAKVINEVGYQNRPVLLKALRQAYPFSSMKGWSYRVWLQEVKVRTGGFRPRKNKLQLDLFEEIPRQKSHSARMTPCSGQGVSD